MEKNGHSVKCLVCGACISFAFQECSICNSPYHKDCWEYNRGCAIYGCIGLRCRPMEKPISLLDFGNSVMGVIMEGVELALKILYLMLMNLRKK